MRRVSIAQLARHVDVEPLATAGAYLGRSVDLGWGRVYGGQTMAQGLAAAQRFVGPDRLGHQFGCHFLRGGDTKLPIRFEVDELSRGRSFSAVHVRALQEEKPILAMTASFQTPEAGLEHTVGGLEPEWGRPDDLKSITEHFAPYLDQLPERLRGLYAEGGSPLDIRPAEFVLPWDPTVRPPKHQYWVRAKEALPDDPRVHERLLTYISDWGLLASSIYGHPTALWKPEVQVASLSHSVHVHREFRLDQQWLCHATHSPVSSGGRGYCLGQFWNEQGELVASTAQEGLIRMRTDRKAQSAQDAL